MKLKIIERLTVLIGLSLVKGFPSSAAISFVTVGYMSPATNFYSVTQVIPSSASLIAILSSNQILLRTPVQNFRYPIV